jgi:Domain of unknown function (DUF5076)
MADPHDNAIYEALVIPNEALDKGGVEILRGGLVKGELYVTARRAFDDPAMWGEVLGELTRRIARIYAAEGKYTHKDALAAIGGAYAADLGAPVVSEPRKAARKTTKRKPTSATKRAKKTARRKARR